MRALFQVYKKPLEDTNQVGGSLLDPTEVKIIFGNLQPIYEIHAALLLQLKRAAINWKEDTSIGALIFKYASLSLANSILIACIYHLITNIFSLQFCNTVTRSS